MASRSLGTLTLDLIAKIGGFTGPMDKASRNTKKNTDSIGASLKSLSKGTALLGGAAAAGFGLMVKHSIDLQDELSKSSQKINYSVESLSALRYTADLAGVAFSDLEGSLGKFGKNIGETFTTGAGAAADAFSDLGVKITDNNGKLKTTEQLFSEVADRFSLLEDSAVKTALSMDLFGKSGKDLIPLLNGGAKGLREGAIEAKRLGLVFNGDTAKAAEDLNDNLSRLQGSITGMANAVAIDAIPDLDKLSKTFADPAFQEGIAAVGKGLVGIGRGAVIATSYLGEFLKFNAEEIAAQIHGIGSDDIPRLTARLKELNAQLDPKNFSDYFNNSEVSDIFSSKSALEAERNSVKANIDAWKKGAIETKRAEIAARTSVADAFSDGADPFNSGTWSENVEKITAAQIKANAELREANKKRAADSAAAAKELQKQYETTFSNLQKEIDLNGINSKQSEIAYEIENGNLKGLSSELQKNLEVRAKSVDLIERNNELLRSQRDVDIAGMGESGRLASVQLEYDLKHGIIKLNDEISEQDKETLIANKKLVEEKEKINDITEFLKNQQRSIDLYGVTSEALKLQYDIQNDIVKVVGGINSAQAQLLIGNQRQIDAQQKLKSLTELTAEAADRVDESFANAWANIDDGFTGLRDGILGGFKSMLGEMAHQALTKPIILGIQQKLTSNGAAGGSGGSGLGLAGSAGIYGAVALAVVAGINVWNKQQDEKFVKLTAAYKQANQGMSAILGVGNRKSDAIGKAIESLKGVNDNVLDVNYDMLRALQDIRTSIGAVAAGFAKTLTGSGDYKALGITEGQLTAPRSAIAGVSLGSAVNYSNITKGTGGGELDQAVGGFIDSISNKINNALYNKKTKVIDSGISIVGATLADLLSGATIEAFNYADVETKKKVFGITTSTKVKRAQEDLGDSFENQLTDVFGEAGKALKVASSAFGIDFDAYLNQLSVKTQDLSLKGLEGDALTKEIESFFGSTLDSWASVLLTGTDVLKEYQSIGESAFDTMLRLATETLTFEDYAKRLGLNFKATGLAAVDAVQDIATLTGGFDALAASSANYYDKFFSDTEKFNSMQESVAEAYAKLGAALPKTRDEFRQLISGINLGTEAGRKQYASLISLTNVTDSYLSALEKETQAKSDAQKAAEEALKSSAGTAFDAFQKAIQANMDRVNDALSSSKQVADSLTSALKGMHLESFENDILSRRAAQAQVIAANAIRKAGGPLPKAGELDDALAALTQPSQDMFSTFEDYARDFYITQKNIKELSDAAGGQVSFDEQNLKALQDSLDYYQKQIDILNGIDGSVLSVRDSVVRLTNALIDAGVPTAVKIPELPTLNNDYEKRQSAIYASALSKATTDSAGTAESTAKTTSDMADTLSDISENLQVSQFAIAKNTLEISKMLKRWDFDGVPPERVEEPI